MNKQFNLQDKFLNEARKQKQVVTLFLCNGVKMSGSIKGFDNFVVAVESMGNVSLIYKHALSTIIPSKQIDISYDAADAENADN